jgi:CheY-like chemotaxis protein
VVTDATDVISSVGVFAPHVAVLDIGLPGLDGYELARKLRQHDDNAQLVLIALTGYGQKEDRERAVAAGFDYHFVKPVEPAELEAAIAAERKSNGQLSAGAGSGTRASS